MSIFNSTTGKEERFENPTPTNPDISDDLVRDEQPEKTELEKATELERAIIDRNTAVDRANDLQRQNTDLLTRIETLESEKQKLALQNDSHSVI